VPLKPKAPHLLLAQLRGNTMVKPEEYSNDGPCRVAGTATATHITML
jgi:hypothetical protein